MRVTVAIAGLMLALLTGWPYELSILVIGLLTLVYTYLGGVKAVIWVVVLQMGIYLVGAVAAMVALHLLTPGGWNAGTSRWTLFTGAA